MSVTAEEAQYIVDHLPEATKAICNQCPWRRASIPGWLGPFLTREWLEIVHSDAPIACHQTICVADDEGEGDWEDPTIKQCLGAATFRANVHKRPRNPLVAVADEPDTGRVFASNDEFAEHHGLKRI